MYIPAGALSQKGLGVQGWEKVCSTKKMNRFHPPEVKQGLQQLEIAKEHLQAAALAAWEAFLGEFALHYAPFRGAVMALASLDALHSLATLACNTG
jgi:DNA mismatch repair protein MSH3